MNQLDRIIRELKSLPYADMMVLATHIHEKVRVEGASDPLAWYPRDVADVLAAIPLTMEPSKMTTAENKIIAGVFTRKRQMNINKFGNGYTIEIPSVPGSVVHGTDLRVMFPQMLDQITTLTAMKA